MSYILIIKKLKKEPVKKTVSAVSIFLIITTFSMSLVSFFALPQYARAANGYIDPNADGSVGSWSSTGTSYYTEIDEAVRQPSTPTTADYISATANSSGNIFINMNSITDVSSATDITIWIYHNDGANGQLFVQLFDDDETTSRATEQSVTQRTTDTWDSITFSGVNLTQAQLDTLSVRVRSERNGGGATATVYIYELYGDVTYTEVQHVIVSTSGTQTSSMDIPSVDNSVGGTFVITEQVSSRSITSITIVETGTVDASTGLDNIELYYDLDTSLPYDCASESFSGTSTETQFGSTDTNGFSSANGTSTFSGSVTITTTQTMCVYAVVDVTSSASGGESVDIEITNPSVDVVASAGNVSPSTAVALSGSTGLNQLPAYLTQSDFRIYENVDAIQPNTALALQNASVTNIAQNQIIRLRMNVLVTTAELATSTQAFKLQYADKGVASNCTDVAGADFCDVGQTASSTIWRGYSNTPADGATTTTPLLSSSDKTETYEEENPSQTNVYAINVGERGEWDWVVQNNGATTSATYCFRMVKSDGTELDTYTNIPELTIIRGLVQLRYRWRNDDGGE